MYIYYIYINTYTHITLHCHSVQTKKRHRVLHMSPGFGETAEENCFFLPPNFITEDLIDMDQHWSLQLCLAGNILQAQVPYLLTTDKAGVVIRLSG